MKRDREEEGDDDAKKQQKIQWWDSDGDVVVSHVELSEQVEEIKQKMGGEVMK